MDHVEGTLIPQGWHQGDGGRTNKNNPQCQVVMRAKSKINQEMGEKVCGCNLEVGEGAGLKGGTGGCLRWDSKNKVEWPL